MTITDTVTCPTCEYEEARVTTNIATLEEYLFCPHCGYTRTTSRAPDDENDGATFLTREFPAFGAFSLRFPEGTHLGRFTAPMTRESVQAFLAAAQQDGALAESWGSFWEAGSLVCYPTPPEQPVQQTNPLTEDVPGEFPF